MRKLMRTVNTQKGFITLSIITTILVILTLLSYIFLYSYIEKEFDIVLTSADLSIESNSDTIYDVISDLKALIAMDKLFIFWNKNNLQKDYRLLARIYTSLDEPEKALKALENCQGLLDRRNNKDRNDSLELEYQIGLCYKALHEGQMAKEHFQNAVEGYQEWFQDSPEDFDEKADRELFLRAYCFLGIEQYLEGDYDSAFNKFGLVHGSILELAQWDFASYRYNSAEPYLLLLSSEYAAKSADFLGNEKQKHYFERKFEIYNYLIDYKEENLQQIYKTFFNE